MSRTEPDRDSVERRLEAVERALADEQPLERTDRLDDFEDRVAELEAAVQAIRGYVGEVRAINEDVERRADRALRKAEALERHVGPDGPRQPTAGTDGLHATTRVNPDESDDDAANGDGEGIFRWG